MVAPTCTRSAACCFARLGQAPILVAVGARAHRDAQHRPRTCDERRAARARDHRTRARRQSRAHRRATPVAGGTTAAGRGRADRVADAGSAADFAADSATGADQTQAVTRHHAAPDVKASARPTAAAVARFGIHAAQDAVLIRPELRRRGFGKGCVRSFHSSGCRPSLQGCLQRRARRDRRDRFRRAFRRRRARAKLFVIGFHDRAFT
jgi:hypothetical protein